MKRRYNWSWADYYKLFPRERPAEAMADETGAGGLVTSPDTCVAPSAPAPASGQAVPTCDDVSSLDFRDELGAAAGVGADPAPAVSLEGPPSAQLVRGRELLAVGIALEHVLGSLRLSPREIETLTRQAQGGSQ